MIIGCPKDIKRREYGVVNMIKLLDNNHLELTYRIQSAVVISDNLMNHYLQNVVVCPITSRIHEPWPCRITTTIAGRL